MGSNTESGSHHILTSVAKNSDASTGGGERTLRGALHAFTHQEFGDYVPAADKHED